MSIHIGQIDTELIQHTVIKGTLIFPLAALE